MLTAARIELRDLRPDDWPEVAAIHAACIRSGDVAFERESASWTRWTRSHYPEHRLVAVEETRVVGWAALAPTSQHACYSGVAEDSVYVAPHAHGRGVGRALLERLVRGADEAGIWTVEAHVISENRASIALHVACGFRIVGVRERIGRLRGEWRDVVLLERRSPLVD